MSKSLGVIEAMSIIKAKSNANELDYQFLMDCLKKYKNPRGKLSRLVKTQALIHLKKGLYLLGPMFLHYPYCPELSANLIYGPSYVSLERALQIYGLIPEHVEMVTSVTFKDSKEFITPGGNYIFAHCHPKSYSIGITTRAFSEHQNALIATPEKALTDMLTIRRGKITSQQQLEQILLEDLRIEEEDLLSLDLNLIQEIYQAHPHSSVNFLIKWLTHKKEHLNE